MIYDTTSAPATITVAFTKGPYHCSVYTDFKVPFANVVSLTRYYYLHV